MAGRLTEVKLNGLTLTTYVYDSNGNRLTKTSPSGSTTYTYDAQDRLLTANGKTFTYTANGELSAQTSPQHRTPNTYSYDVLGNLLAATLPNGTQIEYVHDGQNRRIGKQVNGALVQGFLYQNQLNPVAELGCATCGESLLKCGDFPLPKPPTPTTLGCRRVMSEANSRGGPQHETSPHYSYAHLLSLSHLRIRVLESR